MDQNKKNILSEELFKELDKKIRKLTMGHGLVTERYAVF